MAKQLVQAVETQPWSSSLSEERGLGRWRDPAHGNSRSFRHAAAVHAGPAHPRQLRRSAGGTHTRQPSRIRRTYALSRRRRNGCAGIRPQRALGRCSITRTNRRLPDLVSLRRVSCRLDRRGRTEDFHALRSGFGRRRNLALCERCLLDHGPTACSPGPGCKFRTIPIHLC